MRCALERRAVRLCPHLHLARAAGGSAGGGEPRPVRRERDRLDALGQPDEALAELTRVELHGDHDQWLSWWQAKGEEFMNAPPPPTEEELAAAAKEKEEADK